MAVATTSKLNYLFVTILLLIASIGTIANALQCYQCGQYNDGVGSITPCLNYSANLAHLHLKDCPRKTDKFCIKYVSELSTVRDCVASCVEKEVWDTKTYCCDQNACNAADMLAAKITSSPLQLLLTVTASCSVVMMMMKRHL